MKELAYQELKHFEWIKDFKENHPDGKEWHSKRLPDLMISEYLSRYQPFRGGGTSGYHHYRHEA